MRNKKFMILNCIMLFFCFVFNLNFISLLKPCEKLEENDSFAAETKVQANDSSIEIIGQLYLYLSDGSSTFLFANFKYTGKTFWPVLRLNGENLIKDKDYFVEITKYGELVEYFRDAGDYQVKIETGGEQYNRNITIYKADWDSIGSKIYLSNSFKSYTGKPIIIKPTGEIPEGTTIKYRYYQGDYEWREVTEAGVYKVVAELSNSNYEGVLLKEANLQVTFDPEMVNKANLLACVSCGVTLLAILVMSLFTILLFIQIDKIKKR